jgi:hypothetical protein
MGLNALISTISSYNAVDALYASSSPWPKISIETKCEGRNREIWGVRGRPKTIPLHFPLLDLLFYFYLFIIF